MRAELKARDMDDDTVDIIVKRVSAAIAFTQNPLSLVELGFNDTAGEAAQHAAYYLIRTLPKLKFEPAPDEYRADANIAAAPGLRHRRPGRMSGD